MEAGKSLACSGVVEKYSIAGLGVEGGVLRSLAREEMEPNSKRFCKARSRIKSWI